MGKFNGSPYKFGTSDTPLTDKMRHALSGKSVDEIWKFAEELERRSNKIDTIYGTYCAIPSSASMQAYFSSIAGTPRRVVEVCFEYLGMQREMTLTEALSRLGFTAAQPLQPSEGGAAHPENAP
jgi:hypothetical protein